MQKPIITVLLLIIGLFAITKFQDFIKNNTPENSSNTSVIVQPKVENIANTVDQEFVNGVNQDLNNIESTTTNTISTSSMQMN